MTQSQKSRALSGILLLLFGCFVFVFMSNVRGMRSMTGHLRGLEERGGACGAWRRDVWCVVGTWEGPGDGMHRGRGLVRGQVIGGGAWGHVAAACWQGGSSRDGRQREGSGLQLRVLSTYFCLPGFSLAFRRNLGPDKALRSHCPVPGQPGNPPERQSSRLLCPIGFFSAHCLQVCYL